MSMRITCPGCGRILVLPSDCTAEVLSCPRCLTRIDNPRTMEPFTGVQVEAPPVRETAVTSSPSPLDRGPRLADMDVDVRRDSRRTGCLMTLLPVMGGAGIAYAFAGGFSLLGQGEFRPLLVLLGVLTMLTLVSAGWVATHKPSGTPGANIGRTVLSLLTITGAIVGVGGLLMVAGVILLFVVCLSTGGKC